MIKGLVLLTNFLTSEQEASILGYLYKENDSTVGDDVMNDDDGMTSPQQPSTSWDTSLKRRVMHFNNKGFVYSYRGINKDQTASHIPEWMLALFKKCVSVICQNNGFASSTLNSMWTLNSEDDDTLSQNYDSDMGDLDLNKLMVIVNEYTPGQGISPHIDDPRLFTDWIICVVLGSGSIIEFQRKGSTEHTHQIHVPARALYAMTDEARYSYTHSIRSVKYDSIDGTKTKRGTRVSITFRYLN